MVFMVSVRLEKWLLEFDDAKAVQQALKKGAAMGLWEQISTGRGTRYKFIGRPGDQKELTGEQSALEI
jgi:hypothetical protein